MIISAVSEAIPDRIQAAVYLAAYLPAAGDSLTTLATQDHFSLLGVEGNFLFAEDFSYGYVNPDLFTSAFCPDCDPDAHATLCRLYPPPHYAAHFVQHGQILTPTA